MTSSERTSGDVEAAIARVLAAEAAAAAAISASADAAERILGDARARARRISERASDRLLGLTLRIDAASARRVEDLDAALPATTDDHRDGRQRIARIVDAIAAELTGSAP